MRPLPAITAFLTCAALLSGCGTDRPPSTTSTATSKDCSQNGKYPPSPTVDQLTGLLQRGLDPDVPAADKIDLLQGGAGDPELFNRMIPALQQADFGVTIDGVTDYCNGTANAAATLRFSGQTNESQVPLAAEDGRWKLDRLWTCALATNLQQTSPICP
ncbi:hypothetical protein ACFVMC_12585 [Nocardia sp. NPDC127579]|uniref:hypothetical protein n=1 Tax=Nocardia sp. NPDC127579 TaxID=3345402 RepID=UPI0036323AE7